MGPCSVSSLVYHDLHPPEAAGLIIWWNGLLTAPLVRDSYLDLIVAAKS